jgi:hypothetical protein
MSESAKGGRKKPWGQTVPLLLLIACLGFLTPRTAPAAPPFTGTIFIDPDIITEADPTTYLKIEDAGRGEREMYDRREDWVYRNAFLFDASFSDGPKVEIQVNPEFGDVDAARAEAVRFAPVIGRLPKCLREDLETVWIHKGNNPFGGGNNNLLIHTGQAEEYLASGILEETLVHEASHTSLDSDHAYATKWLAAQAADDEFISTYAEDNPYREDISESFLLYYALKHRPDRISESLAKTISETIPNRIAYFDSQALDLAMGDEGENVGNSATQSKPATTTEDSVSNETEVEARVDKSELETVETTTESDVEADHSEAFDNPEGSFVGVDVEDENSSLVEDDDSFVDVPVEDENSSLVEDDDSFVGVDDDDENSSLGVDDDSFVGVDDDENSSLGEDDDSFVGVDDDDENSSLGEADSFVYQSELTEYSWSLAMDLGDGWKWLDWFGQYFETSIGWIYHYELGWIYLESEDTRSIWLWKQGIGWAWTNVHLYPYLYRHSASDWIYLDAGGESLWSFYDFGGGGWMQLGE